MRERPTTVRRSRGRARGGASPSRRDRPADDRRPAHAVARGAGRCCRWSCRGRRPAPLDRAGQGDRAARALQARRAGAPGHAGLHLRARARRVLRRARPARDRDPRTAARGAGVYPVRSAFPASVSSSLLRERDFQPGSGHRLDVALPGFDGRGVTVALLDTGVDRAQPYLRGRIKDGVDIVGGSDLALAAPHPDNEAEVERHGTELAGIIVGQAVPPTCRASRRAPGCCRSASPDGSGRPQVATPCTRAPTRSSPASSAQSIPTATASRTTPRASRWSASRSRTRRSPTGRSRRRSRARSASTRS